MTDSSSSLKTQSDPRTDLIRNLTKKRGNLKGRLTLFDKYLNSLDPLNLSEAQKSELKLRNESIPSLFDEFHAIQSQIEDAIPESEMLSQLEYRELFENMYFKSLATARCLIGNSDVSKCNSKSTIKLPTITLPTFDGSYDLWIEFRDTYLSIIHNSKDLDDIQKFHYLKSSLKGNALQVIKSLECSADNYVIAWDLLENRYNNSKLLIHNHVKSLFSLQSLHKDSPAHIRKLIDTVLKNLRSLKYLGEPTDQWDTLIIYLIISKLDVETEKEWETYKATIKNELNEKDPSHNKLTLDDLFNFLKNKADMLEMIKTNHSSYTSRNSGENFKKPHQNVHSFVSSSAKNKKSNYNYQSHRTCAMCNGDHSLYSCNSFLNLSITDRVKLVTNKNLCLNCLRKGHTTSDCYFGPCRQCHKKHNSLLHMDNSEEGALQSSSSAASQVSQATPVVVPPTDSSTILHSTSQSSSGTQNNDSASLASTQYLEPVLLSTAIVEVSDSNNKYHRARALLDNGSQHCIITQSLCRKIGAKSIQSTYQITGVGQSITQSTHSCQIKLRSLNTDFSTDIKCLVLPNITSNIPSMGIDRNSIQIPENIKLADPSFGIPSQIDILIGSNLFWDLLAEGKMRLPSGPHLQNTQLGWIISGPLYTDGLRITQTQCNFTNTIDTQLRKFWEIEELTPTVKQCLSADEQACEDNFTKTTIRLPDGRFSVRIPLKESVDSLGDSYSTAKARFLSLERRLERSPDYKQLYCDFMSEYLSLGHMSPEDNFDFNSPHYFLPHHGVLREQSTSTRLRTVFNASQKTSSGKSLNDIQHVGPALHNDLFSILLRFRQYKYVACADIEKMFRQTLIQEDQRNLQLILWREKCSEPICIYKLKTITYGQASAPYLSMRCLRQLGLECKDENISKTILNDFYVDDLITGNDNEQLLSTICKGVNEVCLSGCFPLRKWISNSPEVISSVMQSTENSKPLSLGEDNKSKTLGIGWLNNTDEFYFTSELNYNSNNITKRSILSTVSQIYDPLGLLCPVVIVAKMLLQKLWLCKVQWEDPLPSDVVKLWEKFVNSLISLGDIKVPRHVLGTDPCRVELHIFTDASQCAYGACAYIRTIRKNHEVVVRLLCAKSKVAPIKPMSIPRLELMGSLTGARLHDKILESLRLQFDSITLWTDSTIVLGWLKMSPSILKTFVQNRVVEINDLTSSSTWLHVNGSQNPADLLSRGMSIDELKVSPLWQTGPKFLHDKEVTNWSQNNTENIQDESQLPELKSNVSVNLTCKDNSNDKFPFNRFSNYSRLIRACTYMFRFIHNARSKDKSQRIIGPLTTAEINKSVVVLTKIAQEYSFPSEYDALIHKLPIKSNRSIAGLNVFLDKNNIIRVGGRLEYSNEFSYDKKHPVLLCSKHYFTLLIFRYEHNKLLHAGPQLLLSHVRESWWALGGRNLAKNIVRKCVKCSRMQGQLIQPIMGNLPTERLQPGFPFLRSGVDYCGPMYILNKKGRGAKLEKCYVCLFVCLATRAVHLELVTSLSSECYIMALKRFISKRGKCLQITSDNGKCFVGSAKEFQKFVTDNSQSIIDYASDNNIEFKFIPARAPNFGGLWEGGVKSCKHHLKRVVGNANLHYEEFITVLAQIEAVLNSRPMHPLSTDPNDFSPLTPAHFLIGRPLTAPADDDLTTRPTPSLSRFKRIEQMRQHFWQRWSKEYISELQCRTKWQEHKGELIPNTLVLIKEDNLPPLQWRMGRILSVFPGKDGISRVADIRTKTGITRRAVSKICPLPVEPSSPETKGTTDD